MNSKKDLNEKYISFLEQTKDDTHKAVNHLNDRVLIVDGLNTFIRSFAVNPALNEDGLHVGGMMGFLKSDSKELGIDDVTETEESVDEL